MISMRMEQQVKVVGLNGASLQQCCSKKTIFPIIVFYFIISSEITLASSKPTIQYHNDTVALNTLTTLRTLQRNLVSKNTPEKAVKEALDCNVALTNSAIMYMDSICHRCFNLFRELEIYDMCR